MESLCNCTPYFVLFFAKKTCHTGLDPYLNTTYLITLAAVLIGDSRFGSSPGGGVHDGAVARVEAHQLCGSAALQQLLLEGHQTAAPAPMHRWSDLEKKYFNMDGLVFFFFFCVSFIFIFFYLTVTCRRGVMAAGGALPSPERV